MYLYYVLIAFFQAVSRWFHFTTRPHAEADATPLLPLSFVLYGDAGEFSMSSNNSGQGIYV